MRPDKRLPVEKQDQYRLMDNIKGTDYKAKNGWEPGIKLTRVSEWLPGNGCGVRQAYFIPTGVNTYPRIAWEDYVFPLVGLFEDM